MNKIKVLQIGCGKMSQYTMKFVYEKGALIVGAVDRDEKLVNKDIGNIIGTEDKGIRITHIDNLDKLIKTVKPDIALVTTMSFLSDIKDILRTCALNGLNTLTICEEAFYPQISNPNLYKEIDVIAKANKCTITGCGYQDIFWGNLITTLASSHHQIVEIKGSSSYNVEDYGIALAKAHGAGLTKEEFAKEIASADEISEEERKELIESGKFKPSYMWNTVGWLADKMNLHITSIKQESIPTTSEIDIVSKTLGMTIPKGNATGMIAKVTAETSEKITLVAECIGKVYEPNECDKNEWTIIGNPETTLTINNPNTVELTCADIVNRIPDVINAASGFIPTSQLPNPIYRTKPLNEYIEE